uniref:Uncharacterized protein n=1 Tax=Pavo cristatus TaxID=9049 RepID=A0A8C9FTL1_PAVCR
MYSCISCFQASFQRSNSHDKVRKIVAEEGRTARNLIAWSVPLENKDDDGCSRCQTLTCPCGGAAAFKIWAGVSKSFWFVLVF